MFGRNNQPTRARSDQATITLRIYDPPEDILYRSERLKVWSSRSSGAATVHLVSPDGQLFPIPPGLQELRRLNPSLVMPTLVLMEHVDPERFACVVCATNAARNVLHPSGECDFSPIPPQAFYLREGGKTQAMCGFRYNGFTFCLDRRGGYNFCLQRHFLSHGPDGALLLETYDVPFDSYSPAWQSLMDMLDDKILRPLEKQFACHVASR